MSDPTTVLIVDDEPRAVEAARRLLADEFEVIAARDVAEAEAALAGGTVRVVLCDLRIPGESGVHFLKRLRDLWPDVVRLVICADGEPQPAVPCADRYVAKPWRSETLLETMREAARLSRLRREAGEAAAGGRRRESGRVCAFDRIVHLPGSPMSEPIALGRRASKYDVAVLIAGPSGVGKALLARAIHDGSARAQSPFVTGTCGGVSDQRLESELFGCKRGAFADAYQDRIGLFELADGGTIFLDEIGATSAAFQAKLLRVLQDGEIRPLGADRARKVDVRVISATDRDLTEDVAAGRFRRDLYYRLAAVPIRVPALADRAQDIPAIAARILMEVNQAFGRQIPGFAPQAIAAMMAYSWPGNVLELHNEIQRMAALAPTDAPLAASGLSLGDGRPSPVSAAPGGADVRPLRDQVADLERTAIGAALARHRDNISRAADELGLSRVGLRSKIERYNLRRHGGGAEG